MLQKQAISINFAKGLDQKTDPKQVQLGNFLALANTVYNIVGQLTKRNGFPKLSNLPHEASYLTTFKGDLTAVGSDLQAYNPASAKWIDRGNLQPISLSVMPLIRNNLNQTQADSATAPNGLVCTAYTETTGAAVSYKYAVSDSVTGQNILAPALLPSVAATNGTPKVFVLGNYFVIVYASGGSNLVYLAVSYVNTALAPATGTISTDYTTASTLAFDGVVFNNSLYMAWNGAASASIVMATLNSILIVSSNFIVDATHAATMVSVTADAANSRIWVSYYDGATSAGYALVVNTSLIALMSPTQFIAATTVLNLTSLATMGVGTFYWEVSNDYSYAAIPTHFIRGVTISAPVTVTTGTVGTAYVVIRSVGLASKAFYVDDMAYFMAAYQSPYQPTYFLINASSTAAAPVVAAKLAYSNGGGYLVTGLPSVTVTGMVAQVPYLFKDLIEAANKDTNVPSGTQVNGIYSQTGINLASLNLTTDGLDSAEIGNNLNLSGGFGWMYDGYLPVEQNFFVYPDSIAATTATGAGGLVAQQYFYQFTYEWTDNQGNAFRSAPSIPISITTTTGSSTNTLKVPYLRLTYKTANPVKIVGYRWSTAQQTYYQFTSISQPTLNSTTADSASITDANSDATILGNNIIYTNGGVLENANAPASNIMTLFDTRLWAVDAEDPDLLWFSKQIIEATPVEMSENLTRFIAPNAGSAISTGPITALAPMDDKLIIFKRNGAIYYINGTGPDNTGANSQYSEPIFITGTVGCTNQHSIVMTNVGLMFQSDKGIWILKRSLETEYIGAAVSDFNGATVLSAINVPSTNEVRFTLSTGQTLMYDYYVGQWGTFTGIPGVSSTIFQGLHTYINRFGQVFQERPGTYLDGANPVLISFTTSWLNLAGLQGYQRAYFFYLMGTYLTPHKLNVKIAYDYNNSPEQSSIIHPNNFAPTYGGPQSNGQNTVYGQDTPYGGPGNIEWWRVFLDRQRCSAFRITVEEIYDASFGVPAGQGLTLSGINLVVAVKKGFRPQSAAESVGGRST